MPNETPGPVKAATRLDYGRRVARAMALIAADPARMPTLEELAAAAAFSPCHFHRLYRALTGETPAETLARDRLSRAAALLMRGGLPVAAVARSVGYGSAAAFTRAFCAAYALPRPSPRRSRQRGAGGPALPGGLPQRLPHPAAERMADGDHAAAAGEMTWDDGLPQPSCERSDHFQSFVIA